MPRPLRTIEHPCARDLMTTIRDRRTSPDAIRHAFRTLSTFLAIEATSDLPTVTQEIITGTETRMSGTRVGSRIAALVPILRAGLALTDAFLELLPYSLVWHIGISRDEKTLKPKIYHNGIPSKVFQEPMVTFLLDPMLATGGSAIAAARLLRERGNARIVFVGVLGAPEGVVALQKAIPDVDIVLAALDEELNSRGYIIPGLGDAGDRLFPKE